MQKNLYTPMLIAIMCIFGCMQSRVGEMQFPEGKFQHAVLEKDIEWKPCPPHLPSGCELTVLEGDPKSSDLFTVRFRLEEGLKMPAHTHPKDERVTVLEGKVSVAFGTDGSRADAIQFGPGDYYVNARNAVHTVWIDETALIQITGIGPWEARFVED